MADIRLRAEALTKIVGVVPAFMRPHVYLATTPYNLSDDSGVPAK